MNKTLKTLIVIVLCAVVTIGICAASIWIYSNFVKVTVTPIIPGYSLTLLAPQTGIIGSSIEFSGRLIKDDVGVGEATIYIYQTDSTGKIIELEPSIAPITTNTDGYFTFSWTPTTIGDFYFKAGYETPD